MVLPFLFISFSNHEDQDHLAIEVIIRWRTIQ